VTAIEQTMLLSSCPFASVSHVGIKQHTKLGKLTRASRRKLTITAGEARSANRTKWSQQGVGEAQQQNTQLDINLSGSNHPSLSLDNVHELVSHNGSSSGSDDDSRSGNSACKSSQWHKLQAKYLEVVQHIQQKQQRKSQQQQQYQHQQRQPVGFRPKSNSTRGCFRGVQQAHCINNMA
jgi:hypothetical protein